METNKKIWALGELIPEIERLRKDGKTIVQSHGVFDLIHPGIIQHLNSARTQGDILVVTVIKDKDVRRGPGRPVFPESMRALNVASLTQVDYVCVVDDEKPFDAVQLLQPDIFAKGQAHKERDQTIHQKIFEAEKELYLGQSKIFETLGQSFSASKIINQFLDIYPEDTRRFIERFKTKYSFQDIVDNLNSLQPLKVMLLGDGIIDEYHYCEPLGKAGKANLVVNKYLDHEVFAGGAFAIANHLAGICDEVHLVCLLGESDSREDFVRQNLKPQISPKFFFRDDAPTIVKKRYVHSYLNQKLFEINFINDSAINGALEKNITDHISAVIADYDLVMVSDFGHGFINNKIYETVKQSGKLLGINTQTNAANAGYNLITKYGGPDFVCLDEPEIRLAAQQKYKAIEGIAKQIRQEIDASFLITTLGKKGSIGIDSNNEVNRTPIFSTKVIDTIGAGDAFFSFTAPCFAKGMPLDFVSFIGNAVGALAVQIVGNKKPVEKHELLEFIHSLLS
ncbi:MAG: adenylyltransferase/cytidyltransferase family protein [Candidatus Nitrohelix vancouverensis]|uniref:Adenylyltransferase/cytidyltransferase family protein n=1 Tax=Candidatus Nitrohelix vancouverensis TaxID=2705534 RepID=A0A7T0C2D4_9BACT|nr:MAG: adenylyltransferase/cytidyltransferase family protein [Candidatus Nitrohelix vancouverensis]